MNKQFILRAEDGAGGAGGAGGGDGGTGGAGGTGGKPPGTALTTPPTPGTGDWRAGLPEDIRTNPSLKDFKDVAGLAKSYVHAQTLIGADKIAKPNKNWKPEQWSEFFSHAGRPESPDKYDIGKDVIPADMKVDDAKFAEAKKALHESGLSNVQANNVLKYYFGSIQRQTKEYSDAQKASQDLGVKTLQEEYGDKYESKLDIAKAVVAKFGDETLVTKLEETGLGNDPAFIKLFIKMGEAMMDDKALGDGSGLLINDSTTAIAEIESLKGDKEFQAALGSRMAPGHKQALDKWTRLHEAGYGA